MQKSSQYWIDQLEMEAHPEGGYFKEVYRSGEILPEDGLPERYSSTRNISTSIYFLLKSDQVSNFHRIASDETWHFYAGSPLTIHLLEPEQGYKKLLVGPDYDQGYRFQQTVPREVWFGATVDATDSFTLVGCTVAPGFDFEDFELARREELLREFPGQSEIITKLTNSGN